MVRNESARLFEDRSVFTLPLCSRFITNVCSRLARQADSLTLNDQRPPLRIRENRSDILTQQPNEEQLDRGEEEQSDEQGRTAHREAVPVQQLQHEIDERNTKTRS